MKWEHFDPRNMSNQRVPHFISWLKISSSKTVKKNKVVHLFKLWYSLQFNTPLLFKVLASEMSKIVSKRPPNQKTLRLQDSRVHNCLAYPKFSALKQAQSWGFHLPKFIVFAQVQHTKVLTNVWNKFWPKLNMKRLEKNKVKGFTIHLANKQQLQLAN